MTREDLQREWTRLMDNMVLPRLGIYSRSLPEDINSIEDLDNFIHDRTEWIAQKLKEGTDGSGTGSEENR